MAETGGPPQPQDAGQAKMRLRSQGALQEDLERKAASDRSFGHRSLVRAFVEQQRDDREMRRRYAKILIYVLAGQVVAINLFVVLLGWGKRIGFDLDPWTARAFVLAVFAEIVALVGVVAQYLFKSTQNLLEAINGRGDGRPPQNPAPPAS